MKIFSQNLKLIQLRRKFKITEVNVYVFGERTDRQTATLNYEISTMWETKPKTTPQTLLDCQWDRKMSRGLKPCKLYDGHKSNIIFLTVRMNPLSMEDPTSWSWGANQPHEKER